MMHPSVKPIDEILTMDNSLFQCAFAELSEEEARKQPTAETNPELWLLGHLTNSRYFIANLVGVQEESPLDGQFDKPISEFDFSSAPPLAVIRDAWNGITEKLTARLSEVDEAVLDGPLPQPFPSKEQTVLGGVSFLTHHESYHIGQTSYVRRLLEKDGLYAVLFASAQQES